MNKEIITFFKENKIASICCSSNNEPYCFQCFYAFDEKNGLLFFKSSAETRHAKLLAENSAVAGTVQNEKTDLLTLKGLQFTGTIIEENLPEGERPEHFYHKRFPFAIAKRGHVWCIRLEMVKMTDNTNVFGKKLKWERDQAAN